MVEVTGIEPATSWSQTTRATNCATPRNNLNANIIYHKKSDLTRDFKKKIKKFKKDLNKNKNQSIIDK